MGHTNGFLDTEMFGLCYNRDEVAVGNGPIVSACSAVLSGEESDVCGVRKIMFSRRCTPSNRRGGFMLMPVRNRGIILDYMPRVSNPWTFPN